MKITGIQSIILYFTFKSIMTRITIYLRKTTGKGTKLQIDSQMPVNDLIRQIHKVFNFDSNAGLEIFYRGVCINNKIKQTETISQIGIESNSIIHIVEHEPIKDSNSQQLHFKFILSNQLFQYTIRMDQSIRELKGMICANLRITQEDLTLSYLGVQLDNSLNIRDYQLTSNVLLSGLVTNCLNQVPDKLTYSIQSQNIPSSSIDKMGNENILKEYPLKRAQSQKHQQTDNRGQKHSNVYSSARFNQIQQKGAELSKHNTSSEEDISEEVSQVEELDKQWSMPKMQFDLFAKPMFRDQKIIQTQSIVGDEEEESVYSECLIDVTRIDKKRQYLIQCSNEDTFEDAQTLIARLEHVKSHSIKFLLVFDEASKSGISSRSVKGRLKSAYSSQELKVQKTSCELKVSSGSQIKMESMKMKIVEKAARLKTKTISFQFQICKQF